MHKASNTFKLTFLTLSSAYHNPDKIEFFLGDAPAKEIAPANGIPFSDQQQSGCAFNAFSIEAAWTKASATSLELKPMSKNRLGATFRPLTASEKASASGVTSLYGLELTTTETSFESDPIRFFSQRLNIQAKVTGATAGSSLILYVNQGNIG